MRDLALRYVREGLPDAEVAARVRAETGSRTTAASVATYRSRCKAELGGKVPCAHCGRGHYLRPAFVGYEASALCARCEDVGDLPEEQAASELKPPRAAAEAREKPKLSRKEAAAAAAAATAGALLEELGWERAGATRVETVKVGTSRSPVFGGAGGELRTLGGRARYRLPGSDQHATVGPVTTYFYLYRRGAEPSDGKATRTKDLEAVAAEARRRAGAA